MWNVTIEERINEWKWSLRRPWNPTESKSGTGYNGGVNHTESDSVAS